MKRSKCQSSPSCGSHGVPMPPIVVPVESFEQLREYLIGTHSVTISHSGPFRALPKPGAWSHSMLYIGDDAEPIAVRHLDGSVSIDPADLVPDGNYPMGYDPGHRWGSWTDRSTFSIERIEAAYESAPFKRKDPPRPEPSIEFISPSMADQIIAAERWSAVHLPPGAFPVRPENQVAEAPPAEPAQPERPVYLRIGLLGGLASLFSIAICCGGIGWLLLIVALGFERWLELIRS